MPRLCTLKSLCVETVLFIGVFAMVGHLSVNIWERYLYQTELTNMKCSLHTMKETINHIGNAYDNLQKEVKDIMETSEKKSTMFPLPSKDQQRCQHECNADRRKLHDLQIQATVKKEKDHAESTHSEDECWRRSSKITFAPGKNATTITRNPPKSKGVGTESELSREKDSCRYRDKFDEDMHRCYRDYDYCGRSCNRLKF